MKDLRPKPPEEKAVRKTPGRAERLFKRGSLAFIEGESGDEMFAVRSGIIRLLRQEGENAVVIAVAGAGSVIGEMSFLSGRPHTATAQVVEDATVQVIDRELYAETLKKFPAWLGAAMGALVKRVVEAGRLAAEEIVRKSIAGTLRVLLLMAETEGKKEGEGLLIPFGRLGEELIVITGLGDVEIENVFLHLVLKGMIRFRKDEMDREYVWITKPEILGLYCSYLHSLQSGEKFPEEKVPAAWLQTFKEDVLV